LKERKTSSDPTTTPKQNKQKRKRQDDAEELNDGKMGDEELMVQVYDNIVQAKSAS